MDSRIGMMFCLYLCWYKVNAQLSYVRLQAAEQVRYKIDRLVLTCNPQNVDVTDSISDIIIQKNSTTGWKNVVKIVSTGTLVWIDANMQNRATVITQIVVPTSQAGLQIEVSPVNVACSDEGTYRCEINGNTGSGGGKLDSRSSPVHVSIKVKPISINPITVNPIQPDHMYNPNTVVTMTCYGDVGNPPADLRWCIKRLGIDVSYMGYPDADDIIQGPPSMTDCQNRRTSKLRYNVSKSVEQVDFRCETGGDTTLCGHTSAIAANYTKYRNKDPPITSTTTTDKIYVPNAAVLSCDIKVEKSNIVRWYKDNEVVNLEDFTRYYGGTSMIPDLLIKTVRKEDEGLYICEVSDGVSTRRADPVSLSPKDDTCSSSSTVTIVILSVLLSIVTVVLVCVLLFIVYNRYFVQKRDRIYKNTKYEETNISDHAFDRT